MRRKRLSGSDRRASIVRAAQAVFAAKGFEGATMHDIAREGRISHGLIFQHFATKEALYRAVLRGLIKTQDEAHATFGALEPSAQGLVRMLTAYFSQCLRPTGPYSAESARIEMASLAGDGSYAKLVARRAARFSLKALGRALTAARENGDLAGPVQDPANVFLFLQTLGANLIVARSRPDQLLPYSRDDAQVLQDAVWFCARGIGLQDRVLCTLNLEEHFTSIEFESLCNGAPAAGAPGETVA